MGSADDMKQMLENAKLYQQVLIEPVVAAVEAKLNAGLAAMAKTQEEHLAAQDVKLLVITDHEKRLKTIEGSQKKALVGWGVYATGLSLAIGVATNWLRSHFSNLMRVK
jgi:hypothetical protein